MVAENFLLINKPVDWTSFDVVNYIRKKLWEGGAPKNIKVGHAGTLDPFATGLLIVGVGREATKRLDEFKSLPKTYVATVRLGATSDTGDPTGKISNFQFPISKQFSIPNKSIIQSILKKFIGPQEQTPPIYSAKKVGGKRLYELARAGKTVEIKPQKIKIYKIKLIDYTWPNLEIEIECSAGTYIRSLARDLGEALGVGGYCEKLERIAIGDYSIKNAKDVKNFAL